MHVNATGRTRGTVVGLQRLEEVEEFTYLGGAISQNGDAAADVKHRIGTATAVIVKIRLRQAS